MKFISFINYNFISYAMHFCIPSPYRDDVVNLCSFFINWFKFPSFIFSFY
jgi:hypothetical protein